MNLTQYAQSLQALWRPLHRVLQFLGRIPLRARGRRALVEVICIQAVIALLVPLFLPTFVKYRISAQALREPKPEVTWDFVSFFLFFTLYLGCSILWFTFRWRLRPQNRSRWKQFLIETSQVTLLFSELVASTSIIIFILGKIEPYTFLYWFHDQNQITIYKISATSATFLYLGVMLALAIGSLVAIRISLYLLVFWNTLRRKRLRWALTHAHLMILVWGTVVVYALSIALIIQATTRNSSQEGLIEQFIALAIFIAIAMFFLAVIGILFVLPPSALFSFLFSRGLVRRIQDLTEATSALKSGNYAVRVKVNGEDEIAHLQTDFNMMADQLEYTLKELQEERDNVSTLLQARRELIASVSHELRTPVATVRSYLESTLNTWSETPAPTLRQDLQVMEQQVIRLQSLINDLFTLARAEVGRLEVRNVPVSVELLVRRVVDTMAPVVWRGSRIEVLADIMPVSPTFPRVLADESRLEQILQNLLHNAVRHTGPGGIIVVSTSIQDTSVILQVKDTGEGIAPEELEHIWGRFYRAANARNLPASGSGLGLVIVKDLSEAMGGTVSVESVLGQGSIFTITLPALSAVSTVSTGLLEEDERQKEMLATTDKLLAHPKSSTP